MRTAFQVQSLDNNWVDLTKDRVFRVEPALIFFF